MNKEGSNTTLRSFNNSGYLTLDTSPEGCERFGAKPGSRILNRNHFKERGIVVGAAVLGRGIYGNQFKMRGKKGLISKKVLWYIRDGENKPRPIKYLGNIRDIGFGFAKTQAPV